MNNSTSNTNSNTASPANVEGPFAVIRDSGTWGGAKGWINPYWRIATIVGKPSASAKVFDTYADALAYVSELEPDIPVKFEDARAKYERGLKEQEERAARQRRDAAEKVAGLRVKDGFQRLILETSIGTSSGIYVAERVEDVERAVIARCVIDGFRPRQGTPPIVTGPYRPEELADINRKAEERDLASGLRPGTVWDGDQLVAYVEAVPNLATLEFEALWLLIREDYADKVVFVGDEEIWEKKAEA